MDFPQLALPALPALLARLVVVRLWALVVQVAWQIVG